MCSHAGSANVTMSIWRIVLVTASASCTVACGSRGGPVSEAPIIEHYKGATCISFSRNPGIIPHTREWDTNLTLGNGSKVTVIGAQIPGGQIVVRYPASGRTVVAANAGDYVYPSDVRIDAQNDLLYVKASGLAGGLRQQTWLFEYDLKSEHLVSRQQVVDGGLPAQCAEHPAGPRS